MSIWGWLVDRMSGRELSRLRAAVADQEAQIARLMARNSEDRGIALVRNSASQKEMNRVRAHNSYLHSKIADALRVHDEAKAPNSTVKRMARILRRKP